MENELINAYLSSKANLKDTSFKITNCCVSDKYFILVFNMVDENGEPELRPGGDETFLYDREKRKIVEDLSGQLFRTEDIIEENDMEEFPVDKILEYEEIKKANSMFGIE